jgi:hypothetical protein
MSVSEKNLESNSGKNLVSIKIEKKLNESKEGFELIRFFVYWNLDDQRDESETITADGYENNVEDSGKKVI